jgi:hypothetical protein
MTKILVSLTVLMLLLTPLVVMRQPKPEPRQVKIYPIPICLLGNFARTVSLGCHSNPVPPLKNVT